MVFSGLKLRRGRAGEDDPRMFADRRSSFPSRHDGDPEQISNHPSRRKRSLEHRRCVTVSYHTGRWSLNHRTVRSTALSFVCCNFFMLLVPTQDASPLTATRIIPPPLARSAAALCLPVPPRCQVGRPVGKESILAVGRGAAVVLEGDTAVKRKWLSLTQRAASINSGI